MEIKEMKEVTRTIPKVVGIKCDNCGKIHYGQELPRDWGYFVTEHQDWGNDSCDSIKNHHVCSPKCFFERAKFVVEENSMHKSAEMNSLKLSFLKQVLEAR